MKPSFNQRIFGKAQTLITWQLMKLSLKSEMRQEDIHLLHYTELQKSAEESLVTGPGSRPIRSQETSVLLVIPFRDKWEMTERCLEGILRQDREGLDILIALVDNGSLEDVTCEGIQRFMSEGSIHGVQCRHLRYDCAFNFSYLNNQAVKDCADFGADVVGLVNNDIEFLERDSLQTLIQGTDLPKAGAVGCTLLYPSRLVQHLFVFVGSKIVGSHPYKGKPMHSSALWYQKPRAVGAVTGAVMFLKAELFRSVDGFDEKLPTSYQDVDLCLKLQKAGCTNWVLPHVTLIHHETQTRSREPSWAEAEYVEKKWGNFLFKNPFVSEVWSRKSEHFVLTPRAMFGAFRRGYN